MIEVPPLVRRRRAKPPFMFLKDGDIEADIEAEVERRLAEERQPVAKAEQTSDLEQLWKAFERRHGSTSRIEKEAISMEPAGAQVSRKVETRAVEIRKADTSLTPEQALVKAYGELSPDEYQALRAHDRAETIRKAEADDAAAAQTYEPPVAIRKAAAEVRSRRGNEQLTFEKAATIALRENPDLADLWRAADARSSR